MSQKQKTIKQQVSFEGVGLHAGLNTHMTLKPAPENHGIVFQRVDLSNKPLIPAELDNVVLDSGLPRCTTLGFNWCDCSYCRSIL